MLEKQPSLLETSTLFVLVKEETKMKRFEKLKNVIKETRIVVPKSVEMEYLENLCHISKSMRCLEEKHWGAKDHEEEMLYSKKRKSLLDKQSRLYNGYYAVMNKYSIEVHCIDIDNDEDKMKEIHESTQPLTRKVVDYQIAVKILKELNDLCRISADMEADIVHLTNSLDFAYDNNLPSCFYHCDRHFDRYKKCLKERNFEGLKILNIINIDDI